MAYKELTQLLADITGLYDQQDFDKLQPFNSLSDWEINETKVISQTVNTKISETLTQIKFLTCLPPKTAFDGHWHDCSEVCRVICGTLEDKVTGYTWYKEDIAMFSKGQRHQPINPQSNKGTWLEVIFHK